MLTLLDAVVRLAFIIALKDALSCTSTRAMALLPHLHTSTHTERLTYL
jgi:hypothetical protein